MSRISTQDIKQKEVINIYDGCSLGFVEELEVDLEKGTIEGILVPAQRSGFAFFNRNENRVIRWKDIKRIGDDVILVEVPSVFEESWEENSLHKPQYVGKI